MVSSETSINALFYPSWSSRVSRLASLDELDAQCCGIAKTTAHHQRGRLDQIHDGCRHSGAGAGVDDELNRRAEPMANGLCVVQPLLTFRRYERGRKNGCT